MSDQPAITADLARLTQAIEKLPAGLHSGARGNPLVVHLSPKLSSNGREEFPMHDEGPYHAFNVAWERAFFLQRNSDPKALFPLVTRGKHGIKLALDWLTHYARVVPQADIPLLQNRIKQLLKLI